MVETALPLRRPEAGRPGWAAENPGLGSGLRNLLPTEERIAQLERGSAGGRNNPYNPDLVPTDATMSMETLKDENAGYGRGEASHRPQLGPDPLIRAAKDQYDRPRRTSSMSAISQSAQGAISEAASETGAGTTKIKSMIAKDGSQEGDPRITKNSGSDFLDEEALKAVRLAYPFPPVPDRIARHSLTLEFTFIVGDR
jgi:TonB family protein